MTDKKEITTLTEVMPGVQIDSTLAERLKARLAKKNEDKILEILEKIGYHNSMIKDLKLQLESLTEIK